MRTLIAEKLSRWASVLVATAISATLALMSWGIAVGNLWMSMTAGALLALAIVFGGTVVLVPDDLRSQATERTMRVATSTLEHMRDGLTPEGCNAVCQLILPETEARAVALTDTQCVLAYVGEQAPNLPPGSPNTEPTMEVLESGRMETFTTRSMQNIAREGLGDADQVISPNEGYPVGIIAPLIVAEKAVGTLKLYYRNGQQVDRTQLTIARGLASLLSAQLSSYELDRQAELTARAEVKALQEEIRQLEEGR